MPAPIAPWATWSRPTEGRTGILFAGCSAIRIGRALAFRRHHSGMRAPTPAATATSTERRQHGRPDALDAGSIDRTRRAARDRTAKHPFPRTQTRTCHGRCDRREPFRSDERRRSRTGDATLVDVALAVDAPWTRRQTRLAIRKHPATPRATGWRVTSAGSTTTLLSGRASPPARRARAFRAPTCRIAYRE